MKKLTSFELFVMFFFSSSLLILAVYQILPLGMTEVLGFISGGICVWLTVRENVWNWPIGLANNIVFFILFFQARLYADMALQIIYFGLGIWGWWKWLYGGSKGSELVVSRTLKFEWIAIVIFFPIATWIVRELLIIVNGAAPFFDSLTTVLCLVAQYLLCQKRIENWLFWIIADLIYIPLYIYRDLPLTGVLYCVFLTMCFIGLNEWRISLSKTTELEQCTTEVL